jgi:alpha-1,6-mannosyltransferase
MDAFFRIVRVRPWAAAIVAIAAFALGAALVPYAFLPVRTMLYRGTDGLAILALWFAALGLLLVAGARLRTVSNARVLIAVQLLIGGAIALVAPVLLSSDPIAYVYYGALALAGGDPWHPPLAAAARVPAALADAMRQLYGDPPVASIYGPAFVALEAVLFRIFAGAPLFVALFAQRFIALFAWMAITPLLPPERRARWATDPFVLFAGVFDAHNDLLFLVPVAVALRLEGRSIRGALGAGCAIALAAGIKVSALAALALRPFAAPIAAAILGIWIFVQPIAWTLAPHRIQSGLLFSSTGFPVWLVVGARAAALVAVVAWGATRVRDRADLTPLAAIALICALPIVHPWYALWAVLLVARPGISPAMSRWVGTLEVLALALYIPDVL